MNFSKSCCLSLVSLAITLNSAIAAQEIEHFPLAPALDRMESSQPTYLAKNNRLREYTFKAPDSKTLSNIGNLTAVQGYKVEVYGSEKQLLQEVRNVEPKAFIKGNIIQVGIFSQQNNAEDMVRKLAIKGLWARIMVQ